MEPPPWNVQQCYAHVSDNVGGEGAPSTRTDTRSKVAEKQPVTPDHSKKRPGSSEATGAHENPTSKHRQIIQDWSDEDEEENPTADLLNFRQRKGVEQVV
jgi:predicted lipid-binding transport protein (Tim44 family)